MTLDALNHRRPPPRRSARGRPPCRRVHVGRLGFHGPPLHAIVHPNGGVVDFVVERRTAGRTLH